MKLINLLFLTSTLLLTTPLMANNQIDIVDYVQQVFVEGLPYEEASQYDSSNANILNQMLRQSEYVEHWGKIAVLMEIIGEETVIDDIIDFIENDPYGHFGEPHHRAKKAALYGLGYLIHRTNNKKAIKYLVESLNTDSWNKRGVVTFASQHKSAEKKRRQLSKAALLGLALSGTDETLKEIKKFKKLTKKHSLFRSEVDDLLNHVIVTNAEIRELGMKGYYKEGEKKRKH
ncbi:MAG: hypothetical protein ACI9LX_001150 [Paraglaciecola sp.]|jgi:hypothetical protein